MWALAIVIVFVLMVVTLLLFIVWLTWTVGGRMTRPLAERHELLQEIAETGQPPAAWLIPFQRKLSKIAANSMRQGEAPRIKMQAKAACLSRLDSLIKYLHQTTMIDSEATRSQLLAELYKVRQAWLEMKPEEFL